MNTHDKVNSYFVTRCSVCRVDYPRTYLNCPSCGAKNIRLDPPDPLRGKMASNPTIDANIEKIIEFNTRFQTAMNARSAQGLRNLADWAEQQNLTLAKKAMRAADEMTKAPAPAAIA